MPGTKGRFLIYVSVFFFSLPRKKTQIFNVRQLRKEAQPTIGQGGPRAQCRRTVSTNFCNFLQAHLSFSVRKVPRERDTLTTGCFIQPPTHSAHSIIWQMTYVPKHFVEKETKSFLKENGKHNAKCQFFSQRYRSEP